MIPISVCMIAKNEEQYIGECLKRLAAYDWEIVLVDTGSTDRTVEIARQYTPNIYHFDWCGNFSAARNYSISKANHDTILVVDCDEYLEADETTIHLLTDLPGTFSHPDRIGMITRRNPSVSLQTPSAAAVSDSELVSEQIARVFHKTYIHYTGSIHEQLVPKTPGRTPDFIHLPFVFYHYGYSSPDLKRKKAERNIRMLQKELEQCGADPYLYFQLGQSYFGLSQYTQALPYFEQALAMDVNEQEDYVQTMIESYGYTLLALKQYQKALGLEGVASVFSRQADFVFLMGLIYMNNGLFDEAVQAFLKATTIPAYSVDGTNSYKAFYNAGVIYECTGDRKTAKEYYLKCGDYEPARQRLAFL